MKRMPRGMLGFVASQFAGGILREYTTPPPPRYLTLYRVNRFVFSFPVHIRSNSNTMRVKNAQWRTLRLKYDSLR